MQSHIHAKLNQYKTRFITYFSTPKLAIYFKLRTQGGGKEKGAFPLILKTHFYFS
jgi:hypothetical protein